MKKSYHVALLQKYKDEGHRGYCDHIEGFSTAFVDNWTRGQDANRRKAIRLSKQVGEVFVDGADFSETPDKERGLAAACLLCNVQEEGVLVSAEFEVYKNGVLTETITKRIK